MNRICILLCLVLLLTGCSINGGETAVPVVTEPTTIAVETQVAQPQEVLSHELAMLEGYVVMDEGDVRHNVANWMKFLNACEVGETAFVTVVQFDLEEAGYSYVKYDLSFDGSVYTVEYEKNGELIRDSASALVYNTGMLDDTAEPYDSYECYCLNDRVIYMDVIAEPDFEGVKEIFLHVKEGEPAVKSFVDADSVQGILELLWTADYVSCAPDDYVYGMKLLMTNRDGKELVIELDLNRGYYRYGMQTYEYGEVSDMFTVLGIEQWPDSVLNEFSEYLD